LNFNYIFDKKKFDLDGKNLTRVRPRLNFFLKAVTFENLSENVKMSRKPDIFEKKIFGLDKKNLTFVRPEKSFSLKTCHF
jgi:hypothetical protein